nr:translation initiation factor IF-2 N-terminal domain-containing protein [Microbacterium sp. PI-1]
MGKPRVHEVASELGIDSKVLLKFLRADGEFVKSPSSTIQVPVARRMRQRWPVEGEAFLLALHSTALGDLSRLEWTPRVMPANLDAATALLASAAPSARMFRLLKDAIAGRRFFYLRTDALGELDEPARPDALPPSDSGVAYLADTEQLLMWAGGECAVPTWRSLALAAPNVRVHPVSALDRDAPRMLHRLASARTRDLGVTRAPQAATNESSGTTPRSRPDVVLVYRPTGEGKSRGPATPRRSSDHRWTVRGHSRRQWHPSTKSHEVIWIDPHTAGPRDAPLIDVEHVEVF